MSEYFLNHYISKKIGRRSHKNESSTLLINLPGGWIFNYWHIFCSVLLQAAATQQVAQSRDAPIYADAGYSGGYQAAGAAGGYAAAAPSNTYAAPAASYGAPAAAASTQYGAQNGGNSGYYYYYYPVQVTGKLCSYQKCRFHKS